MYQHLLIATDGSELAGKAVDHGLALAKELGAKVTAVTVSEPLASMMAGEAVYPTLIDEYDKAMEASAKRVLDPLRETADSFASLSTHKHGNWAVGQDLSRLAAHKKLSDPASAVR